MKNRGKDYYDDMEAGRIDIGEVNPYEILDFARNAIATSDLSAKELELADLLFRVSLLLWWADNDHYDKEMEKYNSRIK